MNTYELIKKKRDGHELSRAEIDYLIKGFTDGYIPDYQMAAFLMSVYFRGMASQECVDLTMSMVASGATVDLSSIKGIKLDKHSTGGVGDKTTLVLAPLIAACGGTVAKMTGRELGHTGGTVDKLESIPGLDTELPKEKFIEIANRIQVCLISQTENLTPADKRIYALRNVTATVESIPLIAGSIMSKKLAAGADAIVLDVKTGIGSFTPAYADALELAKTMVKIGEGAGRKTTALITGMEQPLGYAVGNAVEVDEAIDSLNGSGPEDLTELVLALGCEMLIMSDICRTEADARALLRNHLNAKLGLLKLKELVEAQGGNPVVVDNPTLLPQPRQKIEVISESSGFVERIDALEVGMAAKILGAGRQVKGDAIDHAIGILLKKKVGEAVRQGEPLAMLYSDGNQEKIAVARERLSAAFYIGNRQTNPPKLIYARVTKDTVEELDR